MKLKKIDFVEIEAEKFSEVTLLETTFQSKDGKQGKVEIT